MARDLRRRSDPAPSAEGSLIDIKPRNEAELAHSRAEAARLQAALDTCSAELAAYRMRLGSGHAIDFSDYGYRPKVRDWTGSAPQARLLHLLAQHEASAIEWMERICAMEARFRDIALLPQLMTAADEPCWENAWLPGLDACILYTLVATLKPTTYLEVGSGHSTRFVRRAIRDFGLPTRIVSIDPHPTAEIDAICDEVIRACGEDVPLDVFKALTPGDLVFLDSSHRCFQGSDVTVFFTEVLPALPSGVTYGMHDVFLPYDYPADWTSRFYNEQYLLMMYLLGGAQGDAVVFPTQHVQRSPDFRLLRNRLFLGARNLDWLASSFWMRRR